MATKCGGGSLSFIYSLLSMASTFLYFILLMDLAVFSTRVSAFVFVCFRMFSEVRLFLIALASAIVAFGCAISSLEHGIQEFETLFISSMSLFQIAVGTFSADGYAELRDEFVVLIAVLGFILMIVVFLLNMLVAQFTCTYASIYGDMVGIAQLNRIKIIIDAVPAVSERRWKAFVFKMGFHEKLEFNPGDVGMAGGVQMKEAASAHIITTDMVKRFGGSTSPLMQWPAADEDDIEADKFAKIEALINKTLKRVEKALGARADGGGDSSKDASDNQSLGAES